MTSPLDDNLISRLPLPLAQLFRRAHDAKTPRDAPLRSSIFGKRRSSCSPRRPSSPSNQRVSPARDRGKTEEPRPAVTRPLGRIRPAAHPFVGRPRSVCRYWQTTRRTPGRSAILRRARFIAHRKDRSPIGVRRRNARPRRRAPEQIGPRHLRHQIGFVFSPARRCVAPRRRRTVSPARRSRRPATDRRHRNPRRRHNLAGRAIGTPWRGTVADRIARATAHRTAPHRRSARALTSWSRSNPDQLAAFLALRPLLDYDAEHETVRFLNGRRGKNVEMLCYVTGERAPFSPRRIVGGFCLEFRRFQ